MSEHTFPHLRCRIDQGVMVVTLTDATIQDDHLGDTVRADLHAALDRFRARHAIVDLSQVTYLSSSGFRPLLSLYRRLQADGGRVVLCQMRPDVEEVFALTRILRTSSASTAPFERAADVRSAVRMLKHALERVESGVLVLTMLEERLVGDEVAEAVRRDLLDAYERAGLDLVVVDLQGVKTISSAGIRPLLQLRAKAKEKGGFVALCGMSDTVREVFEVTRLTTSSGTAPVVFETAADVPAAVAKLKAI